MIQRGRISEWNFDHSERSIFFRSWSEFELLVSKNKRPCHNPRFVCEDLETFGVNMCLI